MAAKYDNRIIGESKRFLDIGIAILWITSHYKFNHSIFH